MKVPQLRKIKELKSCHNVTWEDNYSWIHQKNILEVLKDSSKLLPEVRKYLEDENNYTKWYVLHAEANAITKVSASTQSSEGSTLYVTLSPCTDCSKLIHQAKIKRVVYNEQYKDTSGLEFLEKAGVEVCQIEI